MSANPFPNPDLIEGHPPYPSPWRVASFVSAYGTTFHSVVAADRMPVIPASEDEAFCAAVVRSRNEGTDEEAIAYVKARWQRALDDAHQTTERVRVHFQAELSKVMETNRSLQDAIVLARESGSVLTLPTWCQPSEEAPEPPKKRKTG
jgi:hypothetical protein